MNASAIAADVSMRMSSACRDAQWDEYGELDFVEPLTKLVEVGTAYNMTPAGRAGFDELLHRLLVNRLRLQRDLTRHPEILDEDVSDPILVMGLPRTGTSKMNRMLSADLRAQSLPTWRCWNPAPFPDARPGLPDPRIAVVRKIETLVRGMNPESIAMHDFQTEGAEEEGFLHLLAFRHPEQVVNWPGVVGYLDYMRSLPQAPSYRYVKCLLQYMQWQDGGRRGRHWVVKNPGHVGYIEEFLTCHPKTTMFLAHRNVLEVIPSFCRTMELTYRGRYVSVDKGEIGRMMLDYWGGEMRRFIALKQASGNQWNMLEVQYRELLVDSIGVIGDIYRRAGIPMTPEAKENMLEWERQNRQHKFGTYKYTLAEYGLTEEMVADAFGSYTGLG